MKRTRKRWHGAALSSLTLLSVVTLYGCQATLRTMGMGPPMGSPEDVADSQDLWKALEKANLVGPQAQESKPYMGTPPHGTVLETLHQEITVNGHTGMAIVKRNYAGPGVSISGVDANRAQYLKAVTVMYQRESGYDPDDKNWFWAKYTPDGGLDVKEKMGMKIKLAGRVAKGMPEGCISCHQGAPGGDFVFADTIQVR